MGKTKEKSLPLAMLGYSLYLKGESKKRRAQRPAFEVIAMQLLFGYNQFLCYSFTANGSLYKVNTRS